MNVGKRTVLRGWYLLLLCIGLIGASLSAGAQEHCLVVQAMALAGYNARMDLLQGTDDVFDTAFRAEEMASESVSTKYSALFKARNQKGEQEDPENHGSKFSSPVERKEYFRRWQNDMKALEADENSEIAVYSDDFDRAIAADPNSLTRRRIAIIRGTWNKEYHLACYWGQPK